MERLVHLISQLVSETPVSHVIDIGAGKGYVLPLVPRCLFCRSAYRLQVHLTRFAAALAVTSHASGVLRRQYTGGAEAV